MQITEHTYRRPVLRSIFWSSLGALATVCSLIAIILLPTVWKFLTELNDIASQLFVLAVYLFFTYSFLYAGVLTILSYLYTRLTVTSDGLEYQTCLGNLKSAWADLYRIDQPWMIILASRKPEIRLHRWTRFVPGNIERKFVARGIPLAQFGKLSGSSLEADLKTFAPHLRESLQIRQPQILQIIWSFLLLAVLVLAISGQSGSVSCERAAHRMQVDCLIKRSWYWIVPLGRSELTNVRGAKISEYGDETAFYQIVVESAKGNRPLNWLPSPLLFEDNNTVQAIDEFVINPARTRFEARIGPPEIIQIVFAVLIVVTVVSGILIFRHGMEKVKF